MNVAHIGLLYGAATLLIMFSGMPIAFALGSVATVFMYFFMPPSALDTVTQNVYEEMSAITLLSIPLFILKGAAIGGMVNGVEFSDPRFSPVWAKAEELGAPLFIHPQGVAELDKRFAGNGWLGNTIGNPLETTIALSHLIFEGTFDRHPGLKVIAAHGGGYLGSYAGRSDHACLVGPAGCNPNIALKKKPTEYLKQIFFDSLIFTPEAIRHLAAQVGSGQIVLGSDYPYVWELHPVDHIFACDFLSDQEKLAILGETAAKLLNIRS